MLTGHTKYLRAYDRIYGILNLQLKSSDVKYFMVFNLNTLRLKQSAKCEAHHPEITSLPLNVTEALILETPSKQCEINIS